MSNIYSKVSNERKKLQEEGNMPEWWSTGGWQLFKEKYLYQAENPREQYQRIASTLAAHTPDPNKWKDTFFELMWKGWLSPATPILSNTGTDRGMPVSCAGTYMGDSIYDIYESKKEVAMLTKMGFGTASYLGDIRPRGSLIADGGKSMGVMPIIQGMHSDMDYVSQGVSRRGSWAGYLPIDHGDFNEVCTYLEQNPDGNNIGWNVSNDFIERLNSGDEEAIGRYAKAMKTKMITGKGYFWFTDKANEKRPQCYKDLGLDIKAAQLCVAPETKILTNSGYETIQDLEGESVNVWNGEEWSLVDVVKTGENTQLLKVTTDSGTSLDCTPYHKFYVVCRSPSTGRNQIIEKRAHELKEGDKLIKSKFPVIEGFEELEYAWENGFYSGDGCSFRNDQIVYLYGEKRKLKGEFSDIFRTWNVQEKQDREVGYTRSLRDKFFVPTNQYTIESRLKWFAGIADSDGTIARNGKTQSIQIGSIEYEFLQDIQMMLQTLGVPSKVTKMSGEGYRKLPLNDGSGELGDFYCKEAYRLLLGQSGICKLLSLGFSPKRLKLTEHVPNRECDRFVKVVSVIDEGRTDDTYCFTEKKRGMGVFNGILTGNCNEISLHSSEEYSYTCVLASMNLEKFDEWYNTDAVFNSIVFLDAVCQEFIERAKNVKGLEKAVAFTKKSRALGLGVTGYCSYLYKNMIPYESLDAHFFNRKVFKYIRSEADRSSEWLAEQWGEPEWCKGTGKANSHRLAIAPTKSTALIMGGLSEGINPDTAMVFTQRSAGGEIDRVNVHLLALMKEKGVYNQKNIEEVRYAMGSVQGVDWLTDEEKLVFKTAFEIDQRVVLRSASARAEYLDQWQSLNLFFAASDSEEYVNEVHRTAFQDPEILGLYYVYSKAGVQASRDECVACS